MERDPAGGQPGHQTSSPLPTWPVALLALLACCLMLVGWHLYSTRRQAVENDARESLAIVSDFKSKAVESWLAERYGDATALAQQLGTRGAFKAWLRDPTRENDAALIRQHLASLNVYRNYRTIVVADSAGTPLLSASGRLPTFDRDVSSLIRLAATTRQLQTSIQHAAGGTDASNDIWICAPVMEHAGSNAAVLAVVVLTIDPALDLFPSIKNWPGTSRSAEIYMVSAQGGSLRFLGMPRHWSKPVPEHPPAIGPIASRILTNGGVLTEGTDYRGTPVFVGTSSVRGTPWRVVAQIDAAEVKGPLRRLAITYSVIIVALIAAVILLMLAAWRRRENVHLSARHQAEIERLQISHRFELLSRSTHDIILLVDGSGRIVEANDSALTAYACERVDLIGSEFRELFVRDRKSGPAFDPARPGPERNDGARFESIHRRRNGEQFPVEITVRRMENVDESWQQLVIRDISAVKSTANEANSLRARLRTALVHGRVSVWEVQYPAGQLHVLQGGDLVKNLTGRSTLEPEDIDEPYRTALANTNKLQRQGDLDSFTHEIPIRAMDGRRRWIRIMGWRISSPGEPVPHYEGLNIDVTTEKEAALTLEAVMAGAAVALLTVDEWGVIQTANRFAEEMYGYSPGELAGMKLTLLAPEAAREVHEASFQRFRETGQLSTLGARPREAVGLRKDGRAFAIEASLSAIQVNDRTLLVVSIYDITDRKDAEAALRESEERFQLSMEATRDGIWDWDKQTDEAYFSPAYYRMFGYEVGEFPAHFDSWKDRLHPDDRDHALKINMDCVEGRCDTFEVEYRMRTKTGEWRWILARGKSVARDSQGKSLRLVGTNTDITDRKNAELAAREQAKLLRMISDNIDEAFWIVDHQSRNIIYTNSAVSKISGQAASLLGQQAGSSLSTIVEEDRAQVLINQMEGFAKGQPYTNEYRVTRPDGSFRWIWSRSFPVFGEDGSVNAFIGVAQDITARKDAERAIRDGERLLQQISSTIDEVFWVAETASGRLTFLSSAFSKLTGLSAEAMKENPTILLDMMPEEDRAMVASTRAKGFAEGTPYSHEYRLISQDGSVRWIWGRGFPVTEHDGAVNTFIGVAQDITERKHSEEILQRTARALRTLSYANEALIRATDERKLFDDMCRVIVEQGGYRMAWVGLAENDPERSVRPVAHSGVEMGYLADANISWADNERGRGPTGTAVREGVVQIIQAFVDNERTLPWREQARTRGYAASAAFPLNGRSGVFGVLTIYALEPDAFGTEEVRLLTDLANNLSFGVEALRDRKEREEVEAKFAQAQKLETIGHLTGGLAHDFNNLLMAIQFGTEFARNSVRSGKAADDHFDMVLDATQRGADLVRRLSVFSRQQQLEPTVINPGQLIRQAIKLIRTALPATITLEIPVGDAVSAINVDAGQFENALLNLAINARDAMPDGGSLIIGAHDAADGMVEISVSDTGTGMSPEIRAKALEPFFTTKEVGKGTGLGLSMVYGFVSQSGGSLAIDSEEGKGTTIRMSFPHAAGSADVAVRRQAGAFEGGRSLGNVVLVDDETGVRRALEILLKPSCKVLAVATTGPEGMKLISSMDRIDLLITDVVLPGGLSGFDLADVVSEQHPDGQVLLISGYSTEAQRRHGDERHYRLLRKPFSPQALMAELEKLAAAYPA